MPDTSNFLLKIAKAIDESAAPFADLNERLQLALGGEGHLPDDHGRLNLASEVWIDKPEGTTLQMQTERSSMGLHLRLEDRGDAEWLAFQYSLPVGALQGARYIGLLLAGEGAGVTTFRPCLRYLSRNGFSDTFPAPLVVFPGGEDEQFVVLRVDQKLAETASGAEMIFFFEGRAFNFTLKTVENIRI